MANEIIFVCNSTNNKNIREGELEILRKYDDKLYFEFGTDEVNIKKRCYNDLKTMEKDFNELCKLKEKPAVEEVVIAEEPIKEKKMMGYSKRRKRRA